MRGLGPGAQDLAKPWGFWDSGFTRRGRIDEDVTLGTDLREFCFIDPPSISPAGSAFALVSGAEGSGSRDLRAAGWCALQMRTVIYESGRCSALPLCGEVRFYTVVTVAGANRADPRRLGKRVIVIMFKRADAGRFAQAPYRGVLLRAGIWGGGAPVRMSGFHWGFARDWLLGGSVALSASCSASLTASIDGSPPTPSASLPGLGLFEENNAGGSPAG